ncbi:MULTISPECIES: DUF4292 domain-containing protein [unclassified Anaeromyxobacter]|uniref:DUF4292 domain-containing protein n=2 Tax=Anaeromyxobacter TaxID=161492 RepID=UPI001F569C29|nr:MULTISPECIES: DUF4292 domain-containing protein [unclassified Anaeromyxobacter]
MRTLPLALLLAAALAAPVARARPVPPAAVRSPPAKGGALPREVAALVRRCVEAYGGEAALARAARSVHEGTVTSLLHPGAPGRIGRAYARPARLRVEVAFGDAQDAEIRVLDGGRGWRRGQEVTGPLLTSMILQAARMDLPALLAAPGAQVSARGTLALGGKELRVLALELAPGVVVEAAIDPDSGRILRSRGSGAGSAPVEFITTYSDFRTVDGVLVPFHEENWANGKTTGETVLSRVEFPASFPPELFRP